MSGLFYKLTLLHRRLDDAIQRERARRAPDGFKLLRLKTLRLAVKDRLHRVMPRGLTA